MTAALAVLMVARPLTIVVPLRAAHAQEVTVQASSRTARDKPAVSADLTPMLRATAYLCGLGPALMAAIAHVESGDDPTAVSPRGGIGLIQLIPDTAARFGVANPADQVENLLEAARFPSYLWQAAGAGRTLPKVLAAYNAGEGAVARHEGIPPYAETQNYVRKVLIAYLTQPAPPPVRRDLSRSAPHRRYSATDAPAEERADPFRQLELIQRNRALAAKSHSGGNQPAGK
jgi:soluble lytic murein transglycosylase-like protein